MTNALVLLLVALSVAAIAPAYLNHDAAWYLYVVREWLRGATLYRDVIDTNPPLIIWLSGIPGSIAFMVGLPATALFKLFVFTAAALSVAAVRAVVRGAWPAREFVLVTAAVFLMLPFVKMDFGQREHFAVLLTLPYVLMSAAPRAAGGGPLRLGVGVAAGLGFSIKPHFFLAWALTEAWAVRGEGRRRWRRPEFLAVIGVAALYTIAVLALTPHYLEVASQVRAVYSGLDSSPAVLLRLREVQLWLLAAAAAAAVRWPATDRLPGAVFAAGTGYLAAALLQRKGWGYQLYPARVFLLLFLAAALVCVLEQVPAMASVLRGGRRGLGVVFAAAVSIASVRYIAEARGPATPDLVTPMLRELGDHRDLPPGPLTVLSMRTIIYPAFPAVNYAGADWGLRHNSLWFLPGFYADQDRAGGGPLEAHGTESMPPLEWRFFNQILEDLCGRPPRLLAVEGTPPAAPAGRRSLDLLAYYKQSPRLKALLDVYSPRGSIGPFTILTPTAEPSCR